MRDASKSPSPSHDASPAQRKTEQQEISALKEQILALEAESARQASTHQQTLEEMRLLASQLAYARDQALQASRLKSEFLANMSHEIRTPLNGVVGMTNLLLRTSLDPTQRDFANIIHDSANVLLDIINDILDFSKIESGKLNLEVIDFDVSSTVDAAAQLVAAHSREKQLSLMTFVSPDIPRTVRGDEGHIRQVLLNLIANAVKFTEGGEVIVNVVPQMVGENSVTLRFSVADTGIGFSMEALECLFRPFTQADGSITRKYGGTGLGLSICRGLVELMGGEIGADSISGQGSTFWFTVTLGTPDPCAEAQEPAPDFAGKRVLLVGMMPGTARVLQSYGCAWGIYSDYFADIDQVLQCQTEEETESYDAIIIDSAVVDLTESEFSTGLPERFTRGSAGLVLLSGSTAAGEADKANKAGFSAYLQKPVPQDQLLLAWRDVLTGTSSGRLNAILTQPIPQVFPSPYLILVAEDSPTNRKVAMLQLNSLGFTAQAVANGREAVEAAASGAYSLVLMDCQMPEMDGFQAAGAIRKAEIHTGRHIPIVAMTAHALEGDREKCLSAGMDDYISKPVDVDQLKALLVRWLHVDPDSEPKQKKKQKKAWHYEPADDSLEQTIVDEPLNLSVLQSSCGEAMAKEILEVFLSAAETLLEGIDSARLKRDVRAVESLARQLAGSSRAVGALEVARLCVCMEEAATKQDWAAARSAYESLRWAYKRLRSYLASAMDIQKGKH